MLPTMRPQANSLLKRTAIALVVLAPLALGACAETVGAGAGAYAGNQFGKGKGKWATTAAGALLGGGAGGYLGSSFDRAN